MRAGACCGRGLATAVATPVASMVNAVLSPVMHAGGVVHGHICPEKILVNAMSADIKLSDLGRCVGEGCSVAGSYNMSYMCPEELVVKQQPSAKGSVSGSERGSNA